jgi:outer membrane lipoprotein SlyB
MKTAKKLTNILIASALTFTLTHCSMTSSESTQATGDYNAADVGKINKVVQGMIISGRMVNVINKPNGAETLAASSNGIDADVTRKKGYEYVIRLDSGAIISVVQTEDLHLQPKQHILVIYGATTRVVADEGAEG